MDRRAGSAHAGRKELPLRRRARVDANQSSIVEALRCIGASVAVTSGVGEGFPDILAGMNGRNWLFEIKNPNVPKADQRLTPAQIEFKATWRGHWAVIRDAGEAIEVMTRPRAEDVP